MASRPRAIGFQSQQQQALTDNRFKLYSPDEGETFELYDLIGDGEETTNIIGDHPDVVERMAAELHAWLESCAASDRGEDYNSV